jgi:hypothetical protein
MAVPSTFYCTAQRPRHTRTPLPHSPMQALRKVLTLQIIGSVVRKWNVFSIFI